ncbi:hypothetical protein Tco_0575269 [Tanacetum coccineum]
MVGAGMTRHKAWDDVILKLQSRLSKWKAKTLSIGGRLTLLKSVLGASPLYNMSIFRRRLDSLLVSCVSKRGSMGDKIILIQFVKVSIWSLRDFGRKFKCLRLSGFDSCRIALKRIGEHGLSTSFWKETWHRGFSFV